MPVSKTVKGIACNKGTPIKISSKLSFLSAGNLKFGGEFSKFGQNSNKANTLAMTMSPLWSFITDDESSARAVIKDYLSQYYPDIVIAGEASGVKQAIEFLQSQTIDLLFLDIDLQDGTGFELLDQLPALNFNVIFTTAHNEFAIRAFRYNAVDYLLKPIDPDEFVAAVERAKQHTDQKILRQQYDQLLATAKEKTFDRITLATSTGKFFAETKDIMRIETYGNYSFVFLAANERLLVSKNLKEFEEILPEPDFLRIHQSHIINAGFVKKYMKEDGGYVVMADGTKIPISRRRKDDFISVIRRYLPAIS